MQVLEATFEEDRNQLNEALRKVELVKKDIESKLSPVQQREAVCASLIRTRARTHTHIRTHAHKRTYTHILCEQEYTEELARQNEKDRLRKEYIEELQVYMYMYVCTYACVSISIS